jgi:hypothetical protein
MKKLMILFIAVAIGLMLLVSALLADGSEALRAWYHGKPFDWRRRQVWDPAVTELSSGRKRPQSLRAAGD